MTNLTIANFIYEARKEFGSDNITKVSLSTVKPSFKTLTILVKGWHTSTLVELYMCDDGCYIRNIANVTNDSGEVLRIIQSVNTCLDILNIRR